MAARRCRRAKWARSVVSTPPAVGSNAARAGAKAPGRARPLRSTAEFVTELLLVLVVPVREPIAANRSSRASRSSSTHRSTRPRCNDCSDYVTGRQKNVQGNDAHDSREHRAPRIDNRAMDAVLGATLIGRVRACTHHFWAPARALSLEIAAVTIPGRNGPSEWRGDNAFYDWKGFGLGRALPRSTYPGKLRCVRWKTRETMKFELGRRRERPSASRPWRIRCSTPTTKWA